MKFHQPLLSAVAIGALMFAGSAFAQQTLPPPPPQPTAPMTPPPPPANAMDNGSSMNSGSGQSAVYNTPQGELTVNSQPAPEMQAGPAPSFSQLSGGGNSISEEQASAYAPLANDFLHADRNRNGHVSKAEYDRWKQ